MRFSLATLNLFNYCEPPYACYEFDNIYTQAQWQAKQQWLSEQLKQADADIVGFQEVFSPQALQQLARACGYPYFACVSPPTPNGHTFDQASVALASRWPIQAATALAPNQGMVRALGLPKFSYSRAPLRAEVQVPEFGTLVLVVAHLKSKRSDWMTIPDHLSPTLRHTAGSCLAHVQRLHEACLLHQMLTHETAAAALLVDCNDTPDSATRQLLAGTSPSAQAVNSAPPTSKASTIKLLDAATLLDGADQPSFAHQGKAERIDAVYLNAAFDPANPYHMADVSAVTTFNAHVAELDKDRLRTASDHALVRVTCQVRGL